jgi:outer membrane protein TolC
VSDKTSTHLPIFDDQPGDGPSCSPKVYVSNEEMKILEGMRRLREQAVELRRRLEAAGSADERRDLEAELADLRARRTELAGRREQAFKRKMIMLGHLPPDDEIELI